MRIPWSIPTVSDANKIELDNPIAAEAPTTGRRIYRLKPQSTISDTRMGGSLPAGWTAVDVGSNIVWDATGLRIRGSGTASQVCVYSPSFTQTPGYLEFEWNPEGGGTQQQFLSLCETPNSNVDYYPSWGNHVSNGISVGVRTDRISTLAMITQGAWYKLRCYWKYNSGDTARCVWTIQNSEGAGAGTEFPAETVIASVIVSLSTGATLYWQFNTWKTGWMVFRNFATYFGYPTDGPYLTYVADAGDGKTFSGFVPTNLAATGSWVTTNAKFQYSYDDGTPAYNGSWLTLAELHLVAALTTSKRYIRLLVQANSDGATQQYVGELNADDGTSGAGDFPAVTSVIEADTVQGASGTYHEATVAEVQDGVMFGPASAYEGEYEGGGGVQPILGGHMTRR